MKTHIDFNKPFKFTISLHFHTKCRPNLADSKWQRADNGHNI